MGANRGAASDGAFVLVVAVALVGACGETLPLNQTEACSPDLGSDPANCGGCGTTCAQMESCVKGACVAPTPPNPVGEDLALYVDGSKVNDTGCQRDNPCGSIRAALAEATKRDLSGQEVRVCKGTYREVGLTLDRTMSIRGGFACATWIRDTKALEPTFDPTNETRIENGDKNVALTTLVIRGVNVRREAVIDGLHIVGHSDAAGASAIRIIDSAAPTITDDLIDAVGSVAAPLDAFNSGVVAINAAPEIRKNRIKAAAPAIRGQFIGIIVSQSLAAIHDNLIDGGDGTDQLAGISFRGGSATGANAIRANHIRWSTGANAVGINVHNAEDVEVLGNRVEQGTVACAGTCTSYGIHVTEVKRSTVDGNRVRGASSAGENDSGLAGIRVSLSTAIDVTNNMVHSGNLAARAQGTSAPAAITVGSAPSVSPRIIHNTIVIHDPAGTTARGVQILPNAQNVVVENNLFVGSIGATSDALYVDVEAKLLSVSANAFVNTAFLYHSGNSVHEGLTALESLKSSGTLVDGNVKINTTPKCASGDCIQTCPAAACAGQVLAPWNPPGSDDVIATGFRFASTTCKLFDGAKASTVTTDHFGVKRTAPWSIGAAEVDICQ